MHTLQDRFDLAAKSMVALDRIRSTRETSIQEMSQHLKKKPYQNSIFEEYDDESLEQKLKADKSYYQILFKNLSEDNSEIMHDLLGKITKSIKDVYENLNIKPRSWGFNLNTLLNESESVNEGKAGRNIVDFITRKYYTLTMEQRQDKYFNRIKEAATNLVISENIDPDSSVEFVTKSVVIHDLLETIAFPNVIKDKILESIESKEYGIVFDQEGLKKAYSDFQLYSEHVSKLIACCI